MQRARHTPGRAAGACAGPDNGDIQRSARQEAGGSGYSSRGVTPRSKRALFLLSALMRETRISKNIFIITGRGEGRGQGCYSSKRRDCMLEILHTEHNTLPDLYIYIYI